MKGSKSNPKLVIRSQTQIFFNWKQLKDSTDRFELLFAKIDHFCDFQKI